MNRFEWVSVRSVDDAIDQLRAGAVIKAGGVDLLDLMKEGIRSPGRVVSIQSIPGLDRIEANGSALHLGPLATLAEIGESEAVTEKWPALAAAASKAATPQIRNMATVAGNLLQRPRCWYFRSEDFHCLKKGGDLCFAQAGENEFHAIFDNDLCAIVHPSGMAIPLIAYGAAIEIAGASERRRIPLEKFFVPPTTDISRENSLGADEMIVGINVPSPRKGTRSGYIKQGQKESFDWPLADVAVVLEMDGNRIRSSSVILGSAAPVPRRAVAAEAFLEGKVLNESVAREAGRLAVSEATPLERNAYKVPLFRGVVARALLQAS
ncbi:MAG: FAD binding domain-containing protein [Thermoanaerobaculia bacterium]|nr:FAD binding domain-containing protein [Thermoanaerobaculia bacterium]